MLATRDAQGLYRRVGYRELSQPERWMEIRKVKAYEGGVLGAAVIS